jgi:hypothetical protein
MSWFRTHSGPYEDRKEDQHFKKSVGINSLWRGLLLAWIVPIKFWSSHVLPVPFFSYLGQSAAVVASFNHARIVLVSFQTSSRNGSDRFGPQDLTPETTPNLQHLHVEQRMHFAASIAEPSRTHENMNTCKQELSLIGQHVEADDSTSCAETSMTSNCVVGRPTHHH